MEARAHIVTIGAAVALMAAATTTAAAGASACRPPGRNAAPTHKSSCLPKAFAPNHFQVVRNSY